MSFESLKSGLKNPEDVGNDPKSSSFECYEFSDFRLDGAKRLLWREGVVVSITPKAFDVLLLLVSRRGHVVGKDEILSRVWPDTIVEENNLNVNVSLLRRTLGEKPNEHQFIVTVPGVGYQFVAEVRLAGGGNSETEARKTEASNGSVPRPRRFVADIAGKFPLIFLSLCLAGTIAVVAYVAYSRSARAKSAGTIRSVAVLPFVNNTNDAEAEYLAEGISESLLDSLSQMPGVTVICRSSSFKYKGPTVDLKKAAADLGVDAFLMGRVSEVGDNLVISAELVNARENIQEWGEHYNRKRGDVLLVQQEISREISQTLRLRLTPGEQEQLAKRESVNPQAYELLLKGRFSWSKQGTENRKKAIEFYQEAILVDPAYALAYAELSAGYGDLMNTNVLDPKEFAPKAEAAANKALELNESLPEAHLALAGIKIDAWDWPVAEREIHRALELNPNLAEAHSLDAMYLRIQGRREECVAELNRIRELDPLSLQANGAVVKGLMILHQYDQALEAAKKRLERDQSNPELHLSLGAIYTRIGQYREAIAACHEAIKMGDDTPDAQIYLGVAYAMAGEREKAGAILKQLETGKEYVSPVGFATIHTALGNNEQAFAALETAYVKHDQQLKWLGVDPGLQPLRSDSRFSDLMRRVGLSP